jgi:hypothetical protein
MILLPRTVNRVAVSTTVSPVTQMALVDVKRASTNEIGTVVAFGSSNKAAPNNMINAKLNTNNCAGFKTRVKFLISNLENSKMHSRNIKME